MDDPALQALMPLTDLLEEAFGHADDEETQAHADSLTPAAQASPEPSAAKTAA